MKLDKWAYGILFFIFTTCSAFDRSYCGELFPYKLKDFQDISVFQINCSEKGNRVYASSIISSFNTSSLLLEGSSFVEANNSYIKNGIRVIQDNIQLLSFRHIKNIVLTSTK